MIRSEPKSSKSDTRSGFKRNDLVYHPIIAMLCQLCQKKEADKTNTHYLTDSIIRTCLNLDGVNQRERGYMFDMSNTTPFIEFNFQRSTPYTKIEDALGRVPTEEEIEKAKKNAYSVDHVFCSDCEKKFTDIETKFIDSILSQLRGKDLTGAKEKSFDDILTIRKFFLLQVWRSSVCEEWFDIPKALKETLRQFFNSEISEDTLLNLPLNITYLNTIGDDEEYTRNMVGLGKIEGNFVVFLNDFIIQVFDVPESVKYLDLYGINDRSSFDYFTNINEKAFIIKVIDNEKRLEICETAYQKEKVDNAVEMYQALFRHIFRKHFHLNPSEAGVNDFMQGLIHGKDATFENRFSLNRFLEYTLGYFNTIVDFLNKGNFRSSR